MAACRLQRGRGFTLIELLVVIAIIAVLAVLLLPTMRMVKEQALGSRCASNLRQAALANDVYGSEWEGMLVPGYTGSGGTTNKWQYWYRLLAVYLDEDKIIASPDRGRILRGCPKWLNSPAYLALQHTGPNAWMWQDYSGYCMTMFLIPGWQITSGGAPPYPHSCTLYDTTWGSLTLSNPFGNITRKDSRAFLCDSAAKPCDQISNNNNQTGWDTVQRHQSRANVLFFDYHIERLTFRDAAAQNLKK